jgi:hypothetical protein
MASQPVTQRCEVGDGEIPPATIPATPTQGQLIAATGTEMTFGKIRKTQRHRLYWQSSKRGIVKPARAPGKRCPRIGESHGSRWKRSESVA